MTELGSGLSFLVTTSTDLSQGRRRPASALSVISSHAAKSRWQQDTGVLGSTKPRPGSLCIDRSACQTRFPAARSDQVKRVTSGRRNKQCVKSLTSTLQERPSTDSDPDAQLEDRLLHYTQTPAASLKDKVSLSTEPTPSMSTAVELAASEKALLHFYLTRGRQMMYGTSEDPVQCPALYAFQRGALQKSSVYVHTNIAIAEYQLSLLRGRCPGSAFYRHRASAYQRTSGLIPSPEAQFEEKMFAICALFVAEYMLGHPNLQALHLQAMVQLFNRYGGIRAFRSSSPNGDSLIEPMVYAHQFMVAKPAIEREEACVVGCSLLQTLRLARTWALNLRLSESQRVENRKHLKDITNNLTDAISQDICSLTNDAIQCAGAFYMAMSICLTLAKLRLDADDAVLLLKRIQEMLNGSKVYKIHTLLIFCITASVRLQFIKGDLDVEAEIETANIDGIQAFFLLSPITRLRIASWFVRTVLVVCEYIAGETFSDMDLENIRMELEAAADLTQH